LKERAAMADRVSEIRVTVRLNAKLFRRFALFDAFIRRRRWVSPSVFAGIFAGFALIAFLLRYRAEQAVLLACVLLGVGVVLPAVYFFSYLLSVRAQIQAMKLTKPRAAYILQLDETGLTATVSQRKKLFPWEQMHAAYRRKNCTYLYVSPAQGFLLPHEQLEAGPDALWALLAEHMPPSALHGGGAAAAVKDE